MSDNAQCGNSGPVLTVLCVDDEANILNALRRLLRPQGYCVLTADSGAQALELMAQRPADLVLSDMRMPGMDGAQLLEQVRARWPDTARILLTGYADLSSTVAAINKAEIYRYVSKPWDDRLLLGLVADVLHRKRLEGDKARLERLTQDQNAQLKELNATLEARVQARTAELANALESLGKAHDDLRKSFTSSIRVFANLIELREGVVAGHSRHVAESARQLAQRMQLRGPDLRDVTLAALLHGVGEFGVSDQVLRKPPSALACEERELVMKQPLRAQAALMGLEQLSGAGKLIRSYRERFDGAGYPDRLSGLAIPLGARILAVAHDFEAAQEGTLTGRWLSKLQAREYIIQARGSRYDPSVVDALIQILDESGVKPIAELTLPLSRLEDGMMLTRDLTADDGMLLLSKDTVLNDSMIEQLRRYAAGGNEDLRIYVRPR